MGSIIEIKNMSKTYKRDVIDFEYGKMKFYLRGREVAALKDLNLSIEKGEVFGLLGPNGAGKSTLIKILMTVHYPSAGDATIFGQPYTNPSVRQNIGFLPENPFFYDYLTGYEFLNFYGQLYDMTAERLKTRVPEVIELVGLGNYDIESLPLKGYSKGMLQRMGLAQAILNDPELVILDEPLSGLDPIGRKEIRDVILALKKQGKTIFFSSHILQDVESICDRVAILYKGELKNVGKLTDLLSTEVVGYEVVIKSDSEKLVEALRPTVNSITASGGEIFTVFSPSFSPKEICAQINDLDQNAQIFSVTPRQETLEDYFIRKVKE